MLRFLTKPVLLVLFLLMVVPSLQATEPREEIRSDRSGSIALVSWSFLLDLWEVFSGGWSDNGCEVDPSGRCRG